MWSTLIHIEKIKKLNVTELNVEPQPNNDCLICRKINTPELQKDDLHQKKEDTPDLYLENIMNQFFI